MIKETNKCIWLAAAKYNVRMWKLAEAMGEHESALSRKLRHELDKETQDQIIEIIKSISSGSNKTAENKIKWINIKERLPEMHHVDPEGDGGWSISDYVLVYTKAYSDDQKIYVARLEQDSSHCIWLNEDSTYVLEYFEYWMPLPDDPEVK